MSKIRSRIEKVASSPAKWMDPALAGVQRRGPITQPQGVTGLRQSAGYIREEFLPELVGRQGRRVFQEMETNDPTIGAILFAIRSLIRNVKWTVNPQEGTGARGDEAAELVEGMLHDMVQPWAECVDNACSMFTYGFSIQEILWKQRKGRNDRRRLHSSKFDDNLWAPAALSGRSQRSIERWIFDEDEMLAGFVQYPYDGVSRSVDIRRCLHFRTTTELDNPEGRSTIRNAYRPWYFGKRLEEIEGVGTERDLAGYPLMRVPGEVLEAKTEEMMRQLQIYEGILSNVRRDSQEGVILPSDRDENGNLYYEFELMSAGGSRAIDIDKSITRYDKAKARTVLADFIFLGSGSSTGSFALSSDKTDLFATALGAFLAHFKAQYNDVLLPAIWRLNGFDYDLMPELEPGDLESADLEILANYASKLFDSGALTPDETLEEHFRDLAHLPPAESPGDASYMTYPGMPEPGQQTSPGAPASEGKQEGDKEDEADNEEQDDTKTDSEEDAP